MSQVMKINGNIWFTTFDDGFRGQGSGLIFGTEPLNYGVR